MIDGGRLSLSSAVQEKRLLEFMKQEEARGIGAIDRADSPREFSALLKDLQAPYRASRYLCEDGSIGT